MKEEPFAILYVDYASRPNVRVNWLVALETLKSAFGWSDEELYDHFLFDLQVRYALGLHDLHEGYFDLRTELVRSALEMAVRQRRPTGVIHHSDQGSQYTSIAFGKRCREAGVRPSVGSVGDCYDNALCESSFATLECELLDRRTLRSREEARQAVFHFIEGWYNPLRRHSALGYKAPMRYEMVHADAA